MLLTAIKNQYPNQTRSFYDSVFDACVLYCVKHYTAFEFQNKMKSLLDIAGIGQSCKQFRYDLSENSYFMLNLKMFIFEYSSKLLSPKKDRARVKECIVKYKIEKSDFIFFMRFYDNRINRRMVKAVFRDYKKQPFPSPDEIRDNFSAMYEDVLRYCKSITFKKLTFIVNSNNMTHQDMHYELMYKALKTYYALLPTNKDGLYILNYVKRAVHNHAMNIIQRFKFVKRDRLQGIKQNGEYVFNLQTVSENQIVVDSTNEDFDTACVVNGVDNDNHYEKHNVERSIKKIIRMYTNKKRKLLELIIGEYDEEFTQFLRRTKKVHRGNDNVSLYYSNIEEYKTQACNYLNIQRDTCDRFLKHVYAKHM